MSPSGAGGGIFAATSGFAMMGSARFPDVAMIEVSESVCSGWSVATIWAIMPPIETPTMWAFLMPERVEQPDGIPGHVTDRVRQRCRLARLRASVIAFQSGEAGGVELRREADVAVVEDDDPVAPLHQLLAELDGPRGELAVRAHDQEDGLAVLGAEALVGDGDAVRLDLALAYRDAGSLGRGWFVGSPGRDAEQDTRRDQAEERNLGARQTSLNS